MAGRSGIWNAVADRLLILCEKPPAVVAAVAFLLLSTCFVYLFSIPAVLHLLVAAFFSFVILLLMLALHSAHQRDVRSLTAQIERVTEMARQPGDSTPTPLSQLELHHIRRLLQQHEDHDVRRARKDMRPSLF